MKKWVKVLPIALIVSCAGGEYRTASDIKLIGGEKTTDPLLASFISIPSCSGVLVSSKAIMTAAHCIHDFTRTGKIRSAYAPGKTFAIGNNARNGGSTLVTIASSHVHPSWEKACTESNPCDPKRAGAGNDPSVSDIAVILLTEAVTTIPHAVLDLSPVAVNDPITVAGYGCEGGINSGASGNRKAMATRAVDGTVALAHDGSERGDAIAETLSANFITPGQPDGGPSLCPGDSGGPVYRTGSSKLVGINADYTFIGAYEQTGAIAKSNIHARFDAPVVKSWLVDLLGEQDAVINSDLYLALLPTASTGAFYAAGDDKVAAIELCAGRHNECPAADSKRFSFVTARDGRRFFKSAEAITLSPGSLTAIGRDAQGAIVSRQRFELSVP